jgi:hypothetical protein
MGTGQKHLHPYNQLGIRFPIETFGVPWARIMNIDHGNPDRTDVNRFGFRWREKWLFLLRIMLEDIKLSRREQ